MSTTRMTDLAGSQLPHEAGVPHFSAAHWQSLLDDDRVALSTVSILLTSIIGLGFLGLLSVLGVLFFGS